RADGRSVRSPRRFFFRPRATPANAADPAEAHLLLQQLFAAPRHGVYVQAQELGEELVAAMPEQQGLDPREQAALLLAQQSIKKEHCGLEVTRSVLHRVGADLST